jgi:hypothetical protein
LTLEIWPQMIHALPVWNAGLEEGRQAPESAGKFIRAQFAWLCNTLVHPRRQSQREASLL